MINKATTITRIEKPGSKHLYDVGVCSNAVPHWHTIQVEANNSAQAIRIAERNGYVAGDVNMIG